MRRHAFAPGIGRFVGPAEDQPFSTINTTPLIDVMLVLLIMMIITIPMQQHEIPLNLPTGKASAAELVTHELRLGQDGAAMLDGAAVAGPVLAARLKTIALVGDALTVRTDPAARYEDFAQTLAVVKRAGITKLGFSHGEAVAF